MPSARPIESGPIETKFVHPARHRGQFSSVLGGPDGAYIHGHQTKPMEEVMNTLATKLTITASIAALICATPVSIDLVRGAAGSDATAARLALALDTAQAQPARSGHEAGARGADRRSGGDRAADARGREFKGNDIRG